MPPIPFSNIVSKLGLVEGSQDKTIGGLKMTADYDLTAQSIIFRWHFMGSMYDYTNEEGVDSIVLLSIFQNLWNKGSSMTFLNGKSLPVPPTSFRISCQGDDWIFSFSQANESWQGINNYGISQADWTGNTTRALNNLRIIKLRDTLLKNLTPYLFT